MLRPQRFSPDTIVARLDAEARKCQDEEKRIREAFLAGRMDPDTFVKQYVAAATAAKQARERHARLSDRDGRHVLERLVVPAAFPRLPAGAM